VNKLTHWPLVGHTHPNQIMAWHQGRAISVARFLADVQALAAQLPPRQYLLNMCADRYRFAVGLAAAMVSGKVSLLPPMHTPEMIRQMQVFAPDVFCLHDTSDCTIDLPLLRYDDRADVADVDFVVPAIDCEQLIAVIFTSGSTGTPVPHQKYWGSLVQSTQGGLGRLGLSAAAQRHAIVGTVPPQHMYGFESTVLMALIGGHVLSGAKPFYPADIVAALQAVPAPRLLVSTPVHLRLLLASNLPLPEVAMVLSATAPLSQKLAQEVASRFQAPMQEIYGSTETGMLATRQPAQTRQWRLFEGVQLSRQGDVMTACGAHLSAPVVLNDVIEPTQDHCFVLHGRTADLINIAGKRSSLAHLNHLLNSIAGVIDGAFYMPEGESEDHVVRLAACVVAPTLSAQHILTILREHIDPVFLPRPLLFVASLPRNSTGKLPMAALKNLVQAHQEGRS